MNDEQLTTVNDNELMTQVRESLTGIHMNIPLETIVSHGREVRARRRVPGLAGALAVLAAAAVALSALPLASHPVRVQLAAWTVARQSDGTVKMTIRQLHDPAGLQRTLRADGIPASVTFFRDENPACPTYAKASERLTEKVIHYREYGQSDVVILLRPSALPDQAGVQIGVGGVQLPGGKKGFAIVAGIVQASPRCTGS